MIFILFSTNFLSLPVMTGNTEQDKENDNQKNIDEKEKNEEGSDEDILPENTEISDIVPIIEEEISQKFPDKKYGVHKIALYKDFADVEIFDIERKKRLVFKIMPDSEDSQKPALLLVAEYVEGEIQSWDLVSGKIPALAGTSEIFLVDIKDAKSISVPENFTLYISTYFDFQIAYPRSMYYQASIGNKDSDFLAKVEWAKGPLTPENAEIRLEILSGEISEEKIVEEDQCIFVPRNGKTHFKFSALHDNFEVVKKMRKNFRSEK